MATQPEQEQHDEFLRLFSRYSHRIYNFVFTLVMSHADADEVFQETCVVLWKKFDSYDPEGNFLGWACRIAFLEVSQLRRRGRKLELLSEGALEALADEAIAQTDRLDARHDALDHCVEKLGAEDHALIIQRYRQQRTPKEIAALTSRSVYSVYRALTRVHAQLLDCVSTRLAEEG